MSIKLDSSAINELVEKTLSEDIRNGDLQPEISLMMEKMSLPR